MEQPGTAERAKQAEQGLIGCVLRRHEEMNHPEVASVRPEDMYDAAHQAAWRAIRSLYAENAPTDPVTVYDRACRDGHAAASASMLYAAHESCASPAMASQYASMVRDFSLLRRMASAGREAVALAESPSGPAREMLARAEALFHGLAEARAGGPRAVADSVREALERIGERMDGRAPQGLPSGVAALDDLTGGWQPGLVVLAARPSVGKTAVALHFARAAAARSAVLFCSLEQSDEELVCRMISAESGLNGRNVRLGQLSPSTFSERLLPAAHGLGSTGLHIDDSPGQDVLRIASSARSLARKGLGMVVIDYVQLIEPESRRDPREQQVAQITRRLKGLSRELRVPVIALAQLNREVEARTDKKPKLSDLRECVTGDTLVQRHHDGEWSLVPVRELRPGDSVAAIDWLAERWPSKIRDVWSTGVKEVLTLHCETGMTITATDNHPMLSRESMREEPRWRMLGDILSGDLVARWHPFDPNYGGPSIGLHWVHVSKVVNGGDAEVFDLHVPRHGNFIANGFITHNSGALEQDADIVILMHRPDNDYNLLELGVAKHRNGAVGDVRVRFDRSLMRFSDLSAHDIPDWGGSND